MMFRKIVGLGAIMALVVCLLGIQAASAGDKLISNYSFESGLANWSEWGNTGAASSSTAQKHDGSYSARITDSSTTQNYGLESAKVSVMPNTVYLVYAWAYIQSGSAHLYIRFYDSSHNYISTEYVSTDTPTNEWRYMKVKATAPSNAAYATALVYSSKENTGTVYWDEIYLTAEYTDLDEQVVGDAPIHSAVFGKDGSGKDVIYAVADGSLSNTTGYPAKLTVVDINSNSITAVKSIPGSAVGWAAVKATDNKIYVGATNTGKLYQYTPGAANVVDLGVAVPGELHVWALAAGMGGKVFGGTSNHAKFFKYETGNGFFEMESANPVASDETYIRSMAHDIANNKTYLGTATNGKLMYYDNNGSGNRYNIMPSGYSDQTFVYSLDWTGGKLFAQLLYGYKMLVLDIVHNGSAAPTVTLDKEIPIVHSAGVSNAVGGKVYYTTDGVLHEYNIDTKTTASLGYTLGINPVADIGVVQLTDQTNWPGNTVVTLGRINGKINLFKYNLQTGHSDKVVLNFSDTPTLIRSVASGPDGEVFTSGYLTGGLGIYTPLRSDLSESLTGFGQAEGMIAYNGKLYQGVYPRAGLYEYDPDTETKTLLFDLKDDLQDRPFGLAAGNGKIFVGTAPVYGELGGALTIYDISTDTKNTIVDIVPDQSVNSLAYHNGYVYGGTSIWGGAGSTPTTSQARFFRYNLSTGAVNTYTLPGVGSSEIQAITGVTVSSDGKLFFWAEGYLMKYDPVTNTVTNKGQKYPISYTVGQANFVFADAQMLVGKGDHLYGSIGGNLFVINKDTDILTTFSTPTAAKGIAQDALGNIYYVNGDKLWRFAF